MGLISPPTPGWPATLAEGRIGLRPIRYADSAAWTHARRRNAAWLAPWEATPPQDDQPPLSFRGMVAFLRREARAGRMLPFVLTYDGELAGQVTVGGMTWGSLCSAHVGYWIDERVAGRGVMPTAVALVIDHCFAVVGLHRVEVNIRPENVASLRVVEKLGLRDEGLRRGLLHIDGAWRDHRSFAVTAEEFPGGLLERWRARRGHSVDS
ncbi:MAG: GNAT family N-acetyltransferase [Actinomycetota bacterium]|nr:GNAT family N-acetyltransferase [Actinomycetota bacterium]